MGRSKFPSNSPSSIQISGLIPLWLLSITSGGSVRRNRVKNEGFDGSQCATSDMTLERTDQYAAGMTPRTQPLGNAKLKAHNSRHCKKSKARIWY